MCIRDRHKSESVSISRHPSAFMPVSPKAPPLARYCISSLRKTPLPPAYSCLLYTSAVPEVVTRPLSPENGIYIPLKGPDISYPKKLTTDKVKGHKIDHVKKSAPEKVRTKADSRPKQNAHQDDRELVKFISLHGDDSDEGARGNKDSDKHDKPNGQRNLHFTPWSDCLLYTSRCV